jgi:outer membrane biogenesis lipoprotein LolB
MRKRVLGIFILLIALLILAACGGGAESASRVQAKQQTAAQRARSQTRASK